MLFAISLSACAQLPKFPQVTQYAAKARAHKPGFYGVDNRTGKRVFRALDDREMDGAQCLSTRDYIESERWIQEIQEIAKQRCH